MCITLNEMQKFVTEFNVETYVELGDQAAHITVKLLSAQQFVLIAKMTNFDFGVTQINKLGRCSINAYVLSYGLDQTVSTIAQLTDQLEYVDLQ